jgi:hypothetical protein
MPGQRLRMRRHAMTGQIGRAGAGDQAHRADAPRYQIRMRSTPDADRQIQPLTHQIQRPVCQLHIKAHARIQACERTQRWRQINRAETHRGSYPQGTARAQRSAANHFFGFFQIRQQLQAALVIHPAVLGQADAPCAAIEQARIQQGLQLCQLARYRRGRHIQALGSRRQAARLHHLAEHIHRHKTIHHTSPTGSDTIPEPDTHATGRPHLLDVRVHKTLALHRPESEKIRNRMEAFPRRQTVPANAPDPV